MAVDATAQDLFRRNFMHLTGRKGVRQTWVAGELDVSPSYLNNMLTGDKPIRPDIPKRVADLFKIPLHMMFAPPTDTAAD